MVELIGFFEGEEGETLEEEPVICTKANKILWSKNENFCNSLYTILFFFVYKEIVITQ